MKPTREQLQANITAMEQQGAKPTDIQSYLDSYKQSQSQTTAPLNGSQNSGLFSQNQQPQTPSTQNAPSAGGLSNTLPNVADNGSTFTGNADQNEYAQKEQQWTQQNADAASKGALGQIFNGIGRGVQNDVVGLRSIGAKITNKLGLESNLDPTSPNYNPLLDSKSATSQLYHQLVAKGQTGWEKFGKTAFDVGSFILPGVGEEALAARGLEGAGTALGLFGGTDSAGVKAATALARAGGYLGDTEELGKVDTLAAKVAGNVIGGTAQTALANNGQVSGTDIAANALTAGLIHGAVGSGLLDSAKQIADPIGYAKNVVANDPAKANGVLQKGVNLVKDSLGNSFLQKEFGLGDKALSRQQGALETLTKHYLPDVTSDGKTLDVNKAWQHSSNDLDEYSNLRNKAYSQLPQRGINEDTVLGNMKKYLTPEQRKSGDIAQAMNILQDKINNKFANKLVGGIRSRNMNMQNWSDLSSEIANKEFGLNSENPSNTTLRPVLYAFRKAVGQTAEDYAATQGKPEVYNAIKTLNGKMSQTMDAQNIIENMRKNPTAFSQLSKHLFSLGVQGMSHVPGAYPAAEIASSKFGNLWSKVRLKNITESPILAELAAKDKAELASKIAGAFKK